MSINYIQTGIVSTYINNNSGSYYEVKNEANIPASSTSIYVSFYDFNQGVFYCSIGGEVRYNKYRDLSEPACCIFHNDVQLAQQQYTISQIITNNITNIQNIVQNIINPPSNTVVDPDSIAAKFSTLTNNYDILSQNYQTLVTEISQNNTNDIQTLIGVNNNTQAIVTLGNKIDFLISILKNLNIRNIGDQTFKNGL